MRQTNPKPLSKTDYMNYLRHPAWLWYKRNQPEALPPDDESLKAILKAGHVFEAVAEELFSDKLRLGFGNAQEYHQLPAKTAEAIKGSSKVLLQAAFKHQNMICICDVVVPKGGKILDIYEIKSSTSLKAEHTPDLAFQTLVIEKNGYRVDKVKVIHINRDYVRRGEIEPNQITTVVDITQKVRRRLGETELEVETAWGVSQAKTKPDLNPIHAASSSFSDWLKIYRHLKSPLKNRLYQLGGIGKRQLVAWQTAGHQQLADIPLDDPLLRAKQLWQLESNQSQSAVVDKDSIANFLNSLEFPLYFLDYETMASPLPAFDGQQPWRQYPFQYSLHRLDSPDGDLKQASFIHRQQSDPAPSLSRQLARDIGDKGTVLTWYMPFEKSCNQTLADLQPSQRDFYSQLNSRILDLMTPFDAGWYKDSRFGASSSIKKVLPVLIPKLSYKQLAIQDGSSAQRLWMEAFLEKDSKLDKDQVAADLLKYCNLDTLAMVEIYHHLRTQAKEQV